VVLMMMLLLDVVVSFPTLLSEEDIMRPILPLREICCCCCDGEEDLDELTLRLALRRRCAAGENNLSVSSLLSECTLGSNLVGLFRLASACR